MKAIKFTAYRVSGPGDSSLYVTLVNGRGFGTFRSYEALRDATYRHAGHRGFYIDIYNPVKRPSRVDHEVAEQEY